MKKIIMLLLSLVLIISASGCGNKEEIKEDTKADIVNQEIKEEKQSKEEAPVVESVEEMENIIDEFNTTTDPERKEELRKTLEAILDQADAKAGVSLN